MVKEINQEFDKGRGFMRYAKRLLWTFTAVFLVVGLFKEGITNFSDAIVLILLGTLLLVESIEYKNNKGKDIRFYSTSIFCIIAYLLAAFIFIA